jgi:hypothetical protein
MLSGNTLFALNGLAPQISGVLWLIAGLTLIASAVFYFLRKDSFLYLALAAIVISQSLIVCYWQDAKFGTIANCIILIVIIINVARTIFNRSVDHELSTMFEAAHNGSGSGQTAKAALPPIVTKWLAISRSTDKVPSRIRLSQKGFMRSKPSADWMSFSGQSILYHGPPCFRMEFSNQRRDDNHRRSRQIWKREGKHADQTILYLQPCKYFRTGNGPGNDASIHGGTDVVSRSRRNGLFSLGGDRFNKCIPINDLQWRHGQGHIRFYKNGLVKSFTAQRFGNFDGEFRKETWEVRVNEHNVINGRLVGSKCKVTWKLKEGDFTWLMIDVKDISYEFDS